LERYWRGGVGGGKRGRREIEFSQTLSLPSLSLSLSLSPFLSHKKVALVSFFIINFSLSLSLSLFFKEIRDMRRKGDGWDRSVWVISFWLFFFPLPSVCVLGREIKVGFIKRWNSKKNRVEREGGRI
jgi:hypothetical protein